MTGIPDAETAWTNWLDTMDGELRDTPKGAFLAGFDAAAARVRAAQAQAWDEGFKHRHSGGRPDQSDPAYIVYGPNPYRRSEPGDEFQNPED